MEVVKVNNIHFTDCLVCKLVRELQLFLYLLESYLRVPGLQNLRSLFQIYTSYKAQLSTIAGMQSLRKMTLNIKDHVAGHKTALLN